PGCRRPSRKLRRRALRSTTSRRRSGPSARRSGRRGRTRRGRSSPGSPPRWPRRREPDRGPVRRGVLGVARPPARQGPELPVPLDATYGRTRAPLRARWAGAVRDVALLVAVGVSDEGYREVLAVEAATGERSETWRGLLQGLAE